MKLENLTWKEVETYLQTNQDLIVPAGTCEQHGPHLPLNTDTLVTERIAAYLSEETGMLVAPPLHYGVNLPCDRIYAGTCSTTQSLLNAFVASILAWWQAQGFQRFFLLSAHGDPPQIQALESIDSATVHVLELYAYEMEDVLDKQTCAKHAGEAETAVMMYLYPERLRRDAIQDFVTPFEQFEPYLMHHNTDPIPGSPGNQGYPSQASAEKGKVLYARMKAHALQWMKRYH